MTDTDTDDMDKDKKDGMSSDLASEQPSDVTDSQVQDPKANETANADNAEAVKSAEENSGVGGESAEEIHEKIHKINADEQEVSQAAEQSSEQENQADQTEQQVDSEIDNGTDSGTDSGTENTAADDHTVHQAEVVHAAEVVSSFPLDQQDAGEGSTHEGPSSTDFENVIALVSSALPIASGSDGSFEADISSEMVAHAKLRSAEMSAQKVRLVADLVRGARVHYALRLLMVTQKKAAVIIHKLLKSAISNAAYAGYDDTYLFISKICVDQGPSTNRWRPRARGRTSRVKHQRCHILIELSEGSKLYFAQRLHKNSTMHIKKYLEQSQIRKSRQNQRKRSKITSASKAALT